MNALRYNKLVYIPIPKIASSTFTHVFDNVLGWAHELIDNVDFDNDIVFSHIMDPKLRHAKGSAEALMQYDLVHLVDDPIFHKLLSTCIFDIHSYPITEFIGEENCYKIDWIPIGATIPSTAMFNKFLEFHNIGFQFNDEMRKNHYDPIGSEWHKTRQRIADRITAMQKEQDIYDTLHSFYRRDIKLYNSVLNKFNHGEATWDKISWLQK